MHGFGFIKAQKRWEIHGLGSRSLQSHVKCMVLVLSRPENTVNHMVLAFTQPQNPVKYMVLASSKPIYQRRISKLPYAKGGCPNYHMPKADVQWGSAAIAVAGKFTTLSGFDNAKSHVFYMTL